VGLDPQTRSHIWSYINELRAREHITMFLTTHYVDEAENCERLAIIDHGEVVATGSPEALEEAVGKDRIELYVDDPAGGATVATLQGIAIAGVVEVPYSAGPASRK
jgi:ABC-2 type transport system ATP-binding protein